MKLDINCNRYENNGLKGFATVKIDDKYVLERVQIRENVNGELYVALPSFAKPVKDKNGEIVMENGEVKKELFPPFHPITAEARNNFFGAILKRFENKSKQGYASYEIPEKSDITKIYAVPYEKDNITGIAKVSFGDSFILENITIKQGQSGEYIDLPSYRQKAKDDNGNTITTSDGKVKYESRDMFHPITAEAQESLRDAIVNSLDARRQEAARAQEDNRQQAQSQGLNRGRGR